MFILLVCLALWNNSRFISRISYSHIMQFCSWMCAELSLKWPRPVIITSLVSHSLGYHCHPTLPSPVFWACRGVYCISLSHRGWICLSFGIQQSHYELTWFCSELWIWFKVVDRRPFFVWAIIHVVFSRQNNHAKAFILQFILSSHFCFQTGLYQPPFSSFSCFFVQV